MNTIRYINAPAGSGKTHRIVEKAVEMVRSGERVLIAIPTRDLIRKTIDEEVGRYPGINAEAIIGGSDEVDLHVVRRLLERLRAPCFGGELVFITHAALTLLPYEGCFSDWHLFVDEVLQVHRCHDVLIGRDHQFLTSLLTTRSSEISDFPFLCANNRRAVKRIAKNEDQNPDWARVSELAWSLRSPNYDVRVGRRAYDKLLEPGSAYEKLVAFASLKPEALLRFRSATIAAANFKESLLYRFWDGRGVTFVEHTALHARLRTGHGKGNNLTIYYAHEGDWSKKLQDKPVTEDQRVIDLVVEKAQAFFDDEPFLWTANKDQPDTLFSGPGQQRLPSFPHGLNSYTDFDNVLFLSALNPRPFEFSYFDALGIDPEQVKTAFYRESVYQAVLRSSLRSPGAKRPTRVVVMDRATAMYLQKQLPDASIEALDWIPAEVGIPSKGGRPRQHGSDTERQAACRRRKKKAQLLEELRCREENWCAIMRNALSDCINDEWCHETSIESNRSSVTKNFFGMQFNMVTATEPSDMFLEESVDAFVERLRTMHQRAYQTKDTIPLFSPSLYDPSLSMETKRGRANIQVVRGFWFDNDGGDLTHERFAELLRGLRIIIFNTFSSTAENPRWRAIIPTTGVMTVDIHDAIRAEIMSIIEGAEYRPKPTKGRLPEGTLCDGFDRSKATAASLFHLPCQAAKPSGTFFVDHVGVGRSVLDPVVWIAMHYSDPTEVENEREEDGQSSEDEPDQLAIRRAVNLWHEECVYRAKGNEHFFGFAVRLALAGVGGCALVRLLTEEAACARSPGERRRQVPSIMRSLRRYGLLR